MNAVESSGTNVPGLSRAIRTMSAMFDYYPHYERHFAQLQLVLFMLGMGATLTIGDFVGVLKRPRSLIVALAGQMLLMPSYIYQQAIALQNWPFAAAISMIFLVAVLAVLAMLGALSRLAKGAANV